jgi:hypothetical protein
LSSIVGYVTTYSSYLSAQVQVGQTKYSKLSSAVPIAGKVLTTANHFVLTSIDGCNSNLSSIHTNENCAIVLAVNVKSSL